MSATAVLCPAGPQAAGTTHLTCTVCGPPRKGPAFICEACHPPDKLGTYCRSCERRHAYGLEEARQRLAPLGHGFPDTTNYVLCFEEGCPECRSVEDLNMERFRVYVIGQEISPTVH